MQACARLSDRPNHTDQQHGQREEPPQQHAALPVPLRDSCRSPTASVSRRPHVDDCAGTSYTEPPLSGE